MRTTAPIRRVMLAAAAAFAACSPEPGQSAPLASTDSLGPDSTGVPQCQPLETRPPNATGQKPAFPNQTRACGIRNASAVEVTVVASGLVHPWAVEPLPGGDFLVTERPGRMRIISAAGIVGEAITGLPAVDARGQGGLLDVALSPRFQQDRTIFWSFSEPRQGGNGTSVARGVLASDRKSVQNVQVIFHAQPTYNGTLHFGSRLAFGPDGMLYITLGERSDASTRPLAQHMDADLGKIVRIAPDGSIPKDNPFVGQAGARPEIWSVGHRNVQAATFDPQGRLWEVEHGTRGGDELNLIQKGKNYGWPKQAYGIEYSGQPIAGSETAPAGFQQPVYYWDPVIAPSGAQFYTGDLFPAWRGNLLVGALREARLVRLVLENDRVTGEEHLLVDRRQRIRDVRQGHDGAVYIVTDENNGELWRLAPRR